MSQLQEEIDHNKHNIWVFVSNIFATGLSLIGCIWVIKSYSRVSRPRRNNMTVNIVLSIGGADFFYSCSNMLSTFAYLFQNEDPRGFFCQFEGILRQASLVMSMTMAISMAIFAYKETKSACEKSVFNGQVFFRKAVWVSALLCITLALMPYIFGSRIEYRREETFCWFQLRDNNPSQSESFLFLMFLEGIPLFSGIVLTYFYYSRARSCYPSPLDKDTKFLLRYPVMLFLIWMPSLLNNIVMKSFDTVSTWFEVPCVLLTHSVGLLNAWVYRIQKKGNVDGLLDNQNGHASLAINHSTLSNI